jgi:hypothetical protein
VLALHVHIRSRTFPCICMMFMAIRFVSVQICFTWMQGTGGVSIYGGKFEDESFDCMFLLVLNQLY